MKFSHDWMGDTHPDALRAYLKIQSQIPAEEKLQRVAEMYDAMIALQTAEVRRLPRIVDAYARRLQIQERLTQEVAQCIQDFLDPLGVGVIAEAQHFCMMMRGVEKQHSGTVTSAMLGTFRTNKETRDEFLSLIRGK